MRGTAPTDVFWTDKTPLPSVASFTRALFARVLPAGKVIVVASGTAMLPGKRLSEPGAAGFTTVTFMESETAVDGMPHTPVTAKSRRAPATSAGPASGPSGVLRVSKMRHGGSV